MVIKCHRDGRIVFARHGYYAPEAMPIISGPARLLRRAVTACGRLAYDNKTWLVPGVPEAADDLAARSAVLAFKSQLARRVDRYRQEAVTC